SFQHEFEQKKPLVIYADHPDFQQTNTLSGAIGQGTGGVTESLKNRVIMPLAQSYRETDAILGHELVHAFQYNIAQTRTGGGIIALSRLPLWLIEGTAEYMSLGREHPLTAMWLRDHILRDEKPDLSEITRNPRYFAYRFGQGIISYLGGTYGDESVQDLYRTALRVGWEGGIEQVFGLKQDSLSMQWWEAIEAEYRPLMAGKTDPHETGNVLLCSECGAGRANVAPAISPDGRYIVFQSEKDLFTTDLFLADVATGEILRPLQRNETPYIDGIRYIDSSGSWSPDSRKLAIVVFAGGNNQLAIIDVQSGNIDDRIEIEGLGAIQNPAWSPDGQSIAFTGLQGGISDLYLYDVSSGGVRQLTNDKHADIHAAWSPDGQRLAFVSDRGEDTNFANLTFGNYVLAFLDVADGTVEPMTVFDGAKHINPIYDATGEGLFFISDPDGFPDVYHMNLASGETLRITRAATGVSGITMASPALTYSPQHDLLAYSVFTERGYIINTAVPSETATYVDVVAGAEPHPGRFLPPSVPGVSSRVASYLNDPFTGLVADSVYTAGQAEEYNSSLQLDYVGQPSIGVGADAFGSYIGGGAAAYFSDMLGDRFLGLALNANGTIKDIGGQAFYLNQKKRINWGGGIQHTPFLRQYVGIGPGSFQVIKERIFIDAVEGLLAYPLSATRRIEGGLGFTRYGFDLEQETYFTDAFGQIIDFERESIESRDPLNLASVSLAFVGDNSYAAFTSPVRGSRFRVGLQAQMGTVNFTTLTADYRRYFNNGGPLTLAARGLHIGRYGNIDGLEREQLGSYFLGFETFIRGYAFDSFNRNQECTISLQGSDCPEIDRLFGHSLGVANVELRLPFTGIEEFGIINFPYIPIEFTAFTDVGLAWDKNNPATWEWSRSSGERVPLVSSGFSARFNILGFLILESYYAYPWQRPEKGWHWGFHIAPG
ncbi:MAG: BamA/TamA family outer membrane protein, partial [Gemmatimonadetes bacterium]|nr:BamA/TamA family outer membrane protein [Gemmatimonadota bacterium]